MRGQTKAKVTQYDTYYRHLFPFPCAEVGKCKVTVSSIRILLDCDCNRSLNKLAMAIMHGQTMTAMAAIVVHGGF